MFLILLKKEQIGIMDNFKYVGNFNRKEDIYPSAGIIAIFLQLLFIINFIGHQLFFK